MPSPNGTFVTGGPDIVRTLRLSGDIRLSVRRSALAAGGSHGFSAGYLLSSSSSSSSPAAAISG